MAGECPTSNQLFGYSEYDDAVSRKLLAKAVYEEWYFNKLDESRKLKKQQHQDEKKDQWQQVRIKRERCEKSQEKFKEWVQKKDLQIRKDRQLKNKSSADRARLNMKADLPYNVWKEQKDKVWKRFEADENRRKSRLDEEKHKQNERRAEAEKAFQTWKKMADEKLKMKLQEKEKKRLEEKENTSKEKEEKDKNAEMAFKSWKRNKDMQLQTQVRELRAKEQAAAATRKQLVISRKQLAQEAFLQWLDSQPY